MREQTGALAPPSIDEHKVRHSRRHGIMASVFSGARPHNSDVNLDLSVEMNRKMQSVLEDTLLKNITLKVRNHYEGTVRYMENLQRKRVGCFSQYYALHAATQS